MGCLYSSSSERPSSAISIISPFCFKRLVNTSPASMISSYDVTKYVPSLHYDEGLILTLLASYREWVTCRENLEVPAHALEHAYEDRPRSGRRGPAPRSTCRCIVGGQLRYTLTCQLLESILIPGPESARIPATLSRGSSPSLPPRARKDYQERVRWRGLLVEIAATIVLELSLALAGLVLDDPWLAESQFSSDTSCSSPDPSGRSGPISVNS